MRFKLVNPNMDNLELRFDNLNTRIASGQNIGYIARISLAETKNYEYYFFASSRGIFIFHGKDPMTGTDFGTAEVLITGSFFSITE